MLTATISLRPVTAWLACACLCLSPAPAAARSTAPPAWTSAALPAVLAQARDFRGRITYAGRRVRTHSAPQAIRGVLYVDARGWSLEESAAGYRLHASADGGALYAAGSRASFDDVLHVDSLANAWMAAMGKLAAEPLTAGKADGVWIAASGMRVYLDPTAASVLGIATADGASDLSFTFEAWLHEPGVALPARITQMRDGVAQAQFAIDEYRVYRETSVAQQAAPAVGSRGLTAKPDEAPATSERAPGAQSAQAGRLWLLLQLLLCCGLAYVCWMRRQGFIERLCRRLAQDPRGWKVQGQSAFVSPDGTLWFDGSAYRVGTAFYGRAATVQQSPLFLRVSAREVPHAVVVPRKFRPRAPRRRPLRLAGFSLIEIMLATSVFALVTVGSVYPALIVLARSDAAAQRLEAAVAAANNALIDEEAAFAYGAKPQPGTKSVRRGELNLTVALDDTDLNGEAWIVTVTVTSKSNNVIFKAATLLGPPVPPPGGTSGTAP